MPDSGAVTTRCSGVGRLGQQGGRFVGTPPCGDQPLGDLFKMGQRHIDDKDRHRSRQRGPVQRVGHGTVGIVAGNEGDRGIGVARGGRNAGIGQPADAGRDTGHDAKGHAIFHQRLGLLGAASEHEGIAALQAQHPLAFFGQIHQPARNVGLRGRGFAPALAGMFEKGAVARHIENPPVHQRVIDHDVGRAQSMQRQQGQQAGIAGAGADQPDMAGGEKRKIGRGD